MPRAKRPSPTILRLLSGAVLFAFPFAATAASPVEDGEWAYGYVRAVEGGATLTSTSGDEPGEVEVNHPVLAGDAILVAREGRVELLLADGSVLRLDGASDVVLERLAFSPEGGDRTTSIRLLTGDLQLLVPADGPSGEPTRIETANATVYLNEAGSYRLAASSAAWTEIVVRKGYAEVVTSRGSTIVRDDEQVVVEGDRSPRISLEQAPRMSSLELWGRELERDAEEGGAYVDERLRYAASSLDRHGEWIEVENRRAWRPRSSPAWRPYWHGRWVYTPSGLLWVSAEPWGWVPYHYGSWDYVGGWGWVWFPDRRFSVAHVTWYWGSDYVGWFPSGYYERHYARRWGWDWGFRPGVYGWAGGAWDPFWDWTFCPTTYLGRRHQRDHHHDGRGLHRKTGWREVPRGLITTDTRPLDRDGWKNPDEARDRLLRDRQRRAADQGSDGEVPDVTAWIAREPKLGPEDGRRLLPPSRPERRSPPLERQLSEDPARPAVRQPGSGNPEAREPNPPRPERPRRPELERQVEPRADDQELRRWERRPAAPQPAPGGETPTTERRRPRPEGDGDSLRRATPPPVATPPPAAAPSDPPATVETRPRSRPEAPPRERPLDRATSSEPRDRERPPAVERRREPRDSGLKSGSSGGQTTGGGGSSGTARSQKSEPSKEAETSKPPERPPKLERSQSSGSRREQTREKPPERERQRDDG